MTPEAGGAEVRQQTRQRRDAVETADRVFDALLDDVEATKGRRTAALHPWGSMLFRPADISRASVDRAARPGDGSPVQGLAPVTLTGRSGASLTTSMWVHNLGAVDVSALALELTALTTDDGDEVAASRGTLVPDRVDVGAKSSTEVRITLRVPDDAVPGFYLGHVRGEGLPGTSALPVGLVVDP
jgi:hypothetical protein